MTSADREDLPHWREYPLGAGAEFSMSVIAALVPFLLGALGLFSITLAVGLAAEERMLFSFDAKTDRFTRISLGPMAGFAWLAGLIACIALLHRDLAVSRAVAAAADRAPRTAVPSPNQVERIAKAPGGGLIFFSGMHAACLGLLVVSATFVWIGDPQPDIGIVLIILAALTAIFTLTAVAVHQHFRLAHLDRRRRISAWWTTEHEQAAWQRAETAERFEPTAPGHRGLIRLGTAITRLGCILIVGSVSLAPLVLVVTRTRNARGPGSAPDPGGETGITVALVTMAALMIAGILGFVGGTRIEGTGQVREKALLRAALADPAAPRPPRQLIDRYTGRSAPHLAQVFAAAAGAGMCLGATGFILGLSDRAELGAGTNPGTSSFADLTETFLIVVIASALLLVVALSIATVSGRRGVGLRNELLRRWPLRPIVSTDPEDLPERAQLGPALTMRHDALARIRKPGGR